MKKKILRDPSEIFFSFLVIPFLGCLFFSIYLLFQRSSEALFSFGLSFFTQTHWAPNLEKFGLLPFLFGTLLTSLLSLAMASPLGICVALFLEMGKKNKIRKILITFIEVLSGIPSIIFGLWGLFFLAPFIQHTIGPFLQTMFPKNVLFAGPNLGIGVLCASMVLSLMILPTIIALSREIFAQISKDLKFACLSLGSTTWEMILIVFLRPNIAPLMTANTLALGRALGETMAVSLVIGNSPHISPSLLSTGATMASLIANEYAEAEMGIHLSALSLVGLSLFVVTLLSSIAFKIFLKRIKQ